jgi:hypothetical protein
VLYVGCLPKGTCYQHCHALVSTTVVALTGADVVDVVVAAAKALASRVPALVGEGPLLLTAALLELLFPAQSAVL